MWTCCRGTRTGAPDHRAPSWRRFDLHAIPDSKRPSCLPEEGCPPPVLRIKTAWKATCRRRASRTCTSTTCAAKPPAGGLKRACRCTTSATCSDTRTSARRAATWQSRHGASARRDTARRSGNKQHASAVGVLTVVFSQRVNHRDDEATTKSRHLCSSSATCCEHRGSRTDTPLLSPSLPQPK